MTKEELWGQIEKLEKQYKTCKSSIYREYAFANNKVKIGDIVEGSRGRIRVEEFKYGITTDANGKHISRVIYYGPFVKKDGSPYKSGKKTLVYAVVSHVRQDKGCKKHNSKNKKE